MLYIVVYHCVISGFRREVDENCDLLGYYAASIANFLPMFRDNISIPSSDVKKLHYSLPKKMGPVGCPETSAS
jgi:hypothetical protein